MTDTKPTTLTTEQVLALAPDASSAKAGRGLAGPRKWATLGQSEQAIWGECQGSGKKPYQVQVDLSGDLAYRCSCPSRKHPCKHALGLLLLRASEPALFDTTSPPDWVADWLAKRSQRQTAKQERASKPVDPAAQAKRSAAREDKVRAGLAELDQWLSDLVRNGLADAPSRPHSFWAGQGARLVDAQAPGVARLVRNLAGIPSSGEGWQGRLLERIGQLHLLIQGYQRLDSLPAPTQNDIRTTIGFTVKEEDLRDEPTVRDTWLVMGQMVEQEDHLRVQRTWLWGQQHGRTALVLHFAPAHQPLDRSLIIGTMLDADLVFYPGSLPLRALVTNRHAPPTPIAIPHHQETIAAATGRYAAALASNPWLERFPLLLGDVTVLCADEQWMLRDAADHLLPIAPRFDGGWQLLALSGGHPVTLLGEWDGDDLLPLGVWAGEAFYPC